MKESTNIHVFRARQYAIEKHGAQMYGNMPYVQHLDEVVALLSKYSVAVQIIGYLHDVAEDTDTQLEELMDEFGPHVGIHVLAISDPPGPDRATKKKRFYEVIVPFKDSPIEQDHDCLIVKAADRLANLRTCVAEGNKDKLKMYREEHRKLKAAIYRPHLCDELWDEITRIVKESV